MSAFRGVPRYTQYRQGKGQYAYLQRHSLPLEASQVVVPNRESGGELTANLLTASGMPARRRPMKVLFGASPRHEPSQLAHCRPSASATRIVVQSHASFSFALPKLTLASASA